MKVRVTRRAQAQIDRAARWWDDNRDRAPNAFDEDLAKAFSLLSAEPRIGLRVPSARVAGIRRLHLARIRYYLFYRIRADVVEVLALWHASRGSGPEL
ncbi:MAG TPA: type II toxin-antitoxin system RelE/ParE family toxin [Casimicrobiaceae bacterium]|nr:type II toxin-antitoxin system RelE/ParE family toxin [Casimicrobiaceae bacterium]